MKFHMLNTVAKIGKDPGYKDRGGLTLQGCDIELKLSSRLHNCF